MSNFNDIIARLKGNLERPLSKIEGTFTMFNLRAVAMEFVQSYVKINWVHDNASLDKAAGAYLDAKALDFGVDRHFGAAAFGKVAFFGKKGVDIPSGTVLFAPDNGVKFATIETGVIGDDGTVVVGAQCVDDGARGNVPAEAVTVIEDTIKGVERVTNPEGFVDGVDYEEDDDFRARIYQKIRYPATSGNVYHYMQWAMSVAGVGAVKVFPLWKGLGTGTVKVSIIDTAGRRATDKLVSDVQAYIDPSEGKGGGQAPIGAIVTVTTATEVSVNVSAVVDCGTKGDLEAVKTEFKQALEEYFSEIAYDDMTESVSVARVGFVLLNTVGVVDYTNLQLNGSTDALRIGDEEVFVIGDVELMEGGVIHA